MGRVEKRKKRKQTQTVGGLLAGLMLVVLLFGVGMQLYQMQGRLQQAREQQETLEQQIRETTKKNQDLEEDIANSDNPEMIEKIAREELDMVVQDERVFYHSGG